MKVNQLNINDWQRLLNAYTGPNDRFNPAAMRIENTMFSTARYYGGMTFNGHKYTYFEPHDLNQPAHPDGTPYVAWLMVREDFLKWATKELRKEAKRDEPAT